MFVDHCQPLPATVVQVRYIRRTCCHRAQWSSTTVAQKVWVLSASVIGCFCMRSSFCLEELEQLHMTFLQGAGGAVLASKGLEQADGTLHFHNCKAEKGTCAALM